MDGFSTNFLVSAFREVTLTAFSEAFGQARLNPTCELDIGAYAETYAPEPEM